MSANKTGLLLNWLIAIAVIFVLLLTVIFFTLSNIRQLSIQQQIQYGIQAVATLAIIFLGLALLVNAYYGAKRAQALEKSAIAAERNIEIAIQNAKLSQERLTAERFMTAVAQLGHEKSETRTGAIYALERVAQEFPREHWTIMEILTAFVRENAPIHHHELMREESVAPLDFDKYKKDNQRTPKIEVNIPYELPKIRTDIQVALTVIGRRNYLEDRENQKINLRNTDIRQADLQGANLENFDLRGCDLSGADLRGAVLVGADMAGAKLFGAILYEANLLKANLRGANLAWANLNRANLSSANLRGANLTSASLRAANLQGANLYKANLQQATLKVANLSAAKLFLANLQGAKLGKANLQLTGLIGANLQGANLNGANLQGANLNAAKLQQTEIYFANLSEASLAEADLHQANLIGANLSQAVLYEANLHGANLMGANLFETNFCDVKLAGAILTGVKNLELQQITTALGDRTTRLPDDVEAPTHWRQSS
ncbi:pentapeptide repeat-containing protein [Calothrix brevissima NIES-22]|nr:pentapeptide repeat-containing protein [Calothrix brevissima NIES-22]